MGPSLIGYGAVEGTLPLYVMDADKISLQKGGEWRLVERTHSPPWLRNSASWLREHLRTGGCNSAGCRSLKRWQSPLSPYVRKQHFLPWCCNVLRPQKESKRRRVPRLIAFRTWLLMQAIPDPIGLADEILELKLWVALWDAIMKF